MNIQISCIAPYVDAVITEKFQTDIYIDKIYNTAIKRMGNVYIKRYSIIKYIFMTV